MVNWKDTATQAQELFTLGRFYHLLVGAYFCEYIAALGYDARLLFRDKGGSIWAKIIYLACRNSFLAVCILSLVGVDVTHGYNCMIWTKSNLLALGLSISLASTLIGMRVVVIWFNDVRIIILVVTSLLATQGCSLYNLIKITGEWNSFPSACLVINASVAFASVVANAACDTILLVAMFVGLCRKHSERGVWRVLRDQGILWVTLVIIAELPTVVIISLNLSPAINLIIAVPEVFVLVIGVTRLYRALHSYIQDDDPSIIHARRSWKVWFIGGGVSAS